jgi:Terminase RNaseH-like domain
MSVLEMELGRKGEEENSYQLAVAGSQLEAAGGPLPESQDEGDRGPEPEPSEEQIKRLIAFILQEREAEEAQTAREKRLAKRREKIEDQLDFLSHWGRLLDSTNRNCPIVGGGRTYRVAAREFLMRERLKIRNKRGRLESLKVNAVQRDYAEKAAKRSIVLKARQLGITTYVAARFFLNCVTRPGTMCVQVAHDQRSAEEIFRIVHRLLANMPEVLRKGALATSHANKRQIIFPHLDSQYRVEAADENAGRGLTIQYLHCSEVSRWPGDAEATLAALRAAVPPDGEIVLESTANGAAGCFYEEWQRAEQMGYSRHFYPWWWEPSYKREAEIAEFAEEELELMQKYKLTAEQIGFRREIRANFGRRAKEEFAEDAESCFLASGDCIFDVDAIEKRLHEELPAMAHSDGGRSITFFPPQPGKEYVIGVDPAGGGSEGDYSCAQVIDRSSGMQVAELRGHLTPEETAARVAILARQYNKALVAVERNNHGHAVLGYLSMVHADVLRYHVKGTEGWLTSMATRPMMLRNLAGVLESAPFLFNSSRLLEECKTFVRRPDSTTGAANGAHDDTVMAMAIALAVRAEMAGQASSVMEVGTL